MKESVVRARIDQHLKANASQVLASCGLEISDAIRLFLRQVVAQGGLPFQVRSPVDVRVVSPKRLRAMKGANQARDRIVAASGNLHDDRMLLIPPAQVRAAKVKWPSVELSE